MSGDRPNILLITSDQQHWKTLGHPRIHAPALNRLRTEGTTFTRAYCNNPVCSPSRSTMITGMYPSWHGCWTIGVKLPQDVPTVGDIFQAHGYDAALIGKAHFQPLNTQPGSESLESQPKMRDLDFWRNFHGPWYGFNHIEVARMHADESHAGQHYGIWLEDKGLKNWRDYFQPWPPGENRNRLYGQSDTRGHAWELPAELHYSTWTAERSIARLKQCAQENKPLFLWASFHDPHPPYLAPEPFASMYDPRSIRLPLPPTRAELDRLPPHFAKTQLDAPDFSEFNETTWANHGLHTHLVPENTLRKYTAVYYGMITLMDQQIGRILSELDTLGIADNTLVVFTTDHGHFLGQHGLIAKGPFHFDDLLRLPFVVRWPQKVSADRSSDALQALIDLPETFLSAAGIQIPGQMQGANQLPVWTGNAPSAREEVIVENRHQPTALHLRTFIDARYKLTIYRDRDWGEMFDLVEDPAETKNLFNDPAYAKLKSELRSKFLNAELKREPTRMPRIANA